MLFAYLGTDDRSYHDYADAATGRMLEVTRGGVYDVRVAPGRHPGLPLPPGDGRWGPAVVLEPGEAAVPADLLSSLAVAEPPPGPEPVLPSPPGEEPIPDGGQPAPSAEE